MKENLPFFPGVLFIIFSVFTFVFILIINILLIEAGILVSTTLGTIFFVNLLIDFYHKDNTNRWIYVNYKIQSSERTNSICEHKPSMLKGFIGKLFKKHWIHTTYNTA
jgi:hypothetical protein